MGDSKSNITWPKVILLGDSLVQNSFDPDYHGGCWGALLAYKLQRVADVVTRGFSGYTSRSYRRILPQVFKQGDMEDVAAVVVLLGVNDSGGKKEEDKAFVPLDEYSANLEYIINYFVEIGLSKDKIVFISPTPYHHEKFMAYQEQLGRTFPTRDNVTSGEFAEACKKVAEKHKLDYVDLYAEMMKDEDFGKYLNDGVHWNRAGADLALEQLFSSSFEKRFNLEEKLLPHWSELNSLDAYVD